MRATADVLLASPIFSSLSHREAQALAGACLFGHHSVGKKLFSEGDVGSSLYVVVDGRLALTRQNKGGQTLHIGTLGPGDVVGEMALLDSAPRSATATVLTALTVVEMRRRSFESLYEGNGQAASKVISALSRTLCHRLREVVDRIEDQIHEDAHDNAMLEGRTISGADTNRFFDSEQTVLETPSIGVEAVKDDDRRGELWRVLWGVQR